MAVTAKRNLWPLIICVLLAVAFSAAAVVTNQMAHRTLTRHERRDAIKLVEANRASCGRVNQLRVKFNARGTSLIAWVASEKSLFELVLRDPYHRLPPELPPALRNQIKALKALAATYGPVAVTDCEKEFPYPDR